jgi:site-specific recombinase XerD
MPVLLFTLNMFAALSRSQHLIDVILDEHKESVIIREGRVPSSARSRYAKARKALLDYLRVRPEAECDYIFLGQRNEAIKSKTVQRAVTSFTHPIGLRDVTPHTLRHTFAKSLINSGVSLDKVATLLVRSNLNTTRIYTTPGMHDLEDAIKELYNLQVRRIEIDSIAHLVYFRKLLFLECSALF